MPVHKFGTFSDQIPEADLFDQILPDLRSQSEQRNTALALHDPSSNDLKQARKHANEMIHVSGAEVIVYIRTENADYDHVWDADPDPTYWNSVHIKGFFKPQPLEAELKKWGVDTPNKAEVVFSFYQIFLEFGERMLRAGDVIQLPYNNATQAVAPKNYRIVNVTPTGNFRYHWLYLTCVTEVLTADITVRPPGDLPMAMDSELDSGGAYRESV